jgi:hypothetical protein
VPAEQSFQKSHLNLPAPNPSINRTAGASGYFCVRRHFSTLMLAASAAAITSPIPPRP